MRANGAAGRRSAPIRKHMDRTRIIDEELAALAAHLTGHQPMLLQAWRARANDDPHVTTANSLSRSQFNDHIPELLDTFSRRLYAWPKQPPAAEHQEDAAAHGLQRWHQGYRLREVTREWAHLQLVLVDYLEQYSAERPALALETMRIARRALAELCSDGVSESVSQYFQLEQIEAAGNVHDLERTIEYVRGMEQQRAELWRQAAHDLRGQTSVVANATAGLRLAGVPEPMRERFFLLLQRSMTSLHTMLNDVISLARLQAGHEQLAIAPFDAAEVLQELCAGLQPQAEERGLYLKWDGPASLAVEGDAVKVRRIAQNLLLNALKYTDQGGVTIGCGDSRENDPARWMLTLQDTGPGFAASPREPIVAALQEATRESLEVDRKAGIDVDQPAGFAPAPAVNTQTVNYERGEGVGLSIVKRLSELLDATVELESDAGKGTVFRVILPRRYAPRDRTITGEQ